MQGMDILDPAGPSKLFYLVLQYVDAYSEPV